MSFVMCSNVGNTFDSLGKWSSYYLFKLCLVFLFFFFFCQFYNCSVSYISKDKDIHADGSHISIHADSSHISGEKKDSVVNIHFLFTPLFELLRSITVNYYQKECALQCAGFPAEWLFALQRFYTNNAWIFDPEPTATEKDSCCVEKSMNSSPLHSKNKGNGK